MCGKSVRANCRERLRALPGDDIISESIASLTHAVTIQRAPHDVWPWLVQMGAGIRAGWYSYDFLDNGRNASAARIVPKLQHLFVMQRKQLLGIAERAEGRPAANLVETAGPSEGHKDAA